MKKLLSLVIGFIFLSNLSIAQETWSVDPAHSNVRFEIGHMGLSFIDGQFKKIAGNIETKGATNFDGAVINFDIDVQSIDTRIEARDNHLRSDDFFSAEKFPKITFKNAVLKKENGNNYSLTGELTMKDVTKKVTFKVVQNGSIVTDQKGRSKAGFTAKTTINRTDFNFKAADKLPSGAESIASNVDITVNVEINKK